MTVGRRSMEDSTPAIYLFEFGKRTQTVRGLKNKLFIDSFEGL